MDSLIDYNTMNKIVLEIGVEHFLNPKIRNIPKIKNYFKKQISNIGDVRLKNKLEKNFLLFSSNGDKEGVKYLLNIGINPNITDIEGETSLHKAVWTRQIDIIEILLKAGVDINSKDRWGNTIMMWATSRGFRNIVEFLIKENANINLKSKWGWTALMNSVYYGHTNIVSILVKAGANTKDKNIEGLTALQIAKKCNQVEIINLLQNL